MLRFIFLMLATLGLAPLRSLFRWLRYCKTPPALDKHFSKDIVLVTGGAQGIGRLIAQNFAQTTATIVLWDIKQEQLDKTVEEMRESGHTVHGYCVDVSDLDQLLTGYERVKEEVGHVTVLVNNAGIVTAKSIFDISLEEFEMVMRVNLLAMVSLSYVKYSNRLLHRYLWSIDPFDKSCPPTHA